MLKFTKYGGTASTRSLSFLSQLEKPFEAAKFSEDVTSNEAPIKKAPECQMNEPEKNTMCLSTMSVHRESCSQAGLEVHLKLSKISKEELLKLDSEEYKLCEQQSTVASAYCHRTHRRKCGLPEDTKIHRTRSMKSTSTSPSLPATIHKKLPVYNDGYFPKVQPLSKFFVTTKSK